MISGCAAAMVENALEVKGDQLVKSARTMYLDVSEKGTISHYLGAIFAKIIAGKMFQDDYLVHINQIEQPGLTEIGRYGKKYRYDLIGMQKGSGSYSVWESVGRSENSQLAFRNACREAEGVARIGNGAPLHKVACMNYYERGFYTAVIREVPQTEEGQAFDFTREAYLRAYYQPLMELLLSERPELLYQSHGSFCTTEISLPALNNEFKGHRRMYVGMGRQLLDCLRSGRYEKADEWKNTEIPQGGGWFEGRDGLSVRAEE